MIFVYKDRIIQIEWSIFRGTSQVPEDFSRALVKLFLVGNYEKYAVPVTAEGGTLVAQMPQDLPDGAYSLEAIWVKNYNNLFPVKGTGTPTVGLKNIRYPGPCHNDYGMIHPWDHRSNDRCLMRSRKEYVFAVTSYPGEETAVNEDSIVTVRINSAVATYGYDGLSAYELAVMRGDFNGTEGEYLEQLKYELKVATDKKLGGITASEKTDGDTVEVKIDPETGKLYVPPSEAGEIEVATETTLGGIKAAEKTDNETVEVKIGKDGKLYAPKSEELKIATETILGGVKASSKTEKETEEVKIDPKTGKLYTKSGNNPDDEDLHLIEKGGELVLQFADKEYNADSFSGLGRVYLRKNISGEKNVLTQAMMSKANTKYVIQYDYDLNGETITFPENCTLDFQGGKLKNGNIIFNNTIFSGLINFSSDIKPSGIINMPYIRAIWFGAKENGINDDTNSLRTAIMAALSSDKDVIVSGKLYVTDTINVNGIKLVGEFSPSGQIMYYTGKRVGNITFDFIKNTGEGASITFQEMLSDRYVGSCIVSDIANPILEVTKDRDNSYGFNLENIGIIGWIRNENQVGLKCNADFSNTYLSGNHRFSNILVSGFGSNGVEIQSLEVQTIDNCEFSCNNGYGLKIEGKDTVDNPTEYVVFNNCNFNYNRLDGIYIKNSIRKMVEFNNCNFQMPGQYELGEVNDSYGERIIPSDIRDAVAGVRIENGALKGTVNRAVLNVKFNGCFGELIVKAIHLEFNVGSKYLNNFVFTNNYFIKLGTCDSSLMLYIKAGGMYYPYIQNNDANIDTKYLIEGSPEITYVNAEPYFLNAIPETSNYSNGFYKKLKITKELNYDDVGKSYNIAQEGESEVTIDLPSILMANYYPENNTTNGSKIMFTLLVGYNRNSNTMSTNPVFDIITVTRETDNSYLMCNLTKDIESLTIDKLTGDLSLTCPAYHIVRVQRLDLINKFL